MTVRTPRESADARTDSLVVRSLTDMVRQILARHRLAKLDKISTIEY